MLNRTQPTRTWTEAQLLTRTLDSRSVLMHHPLSIETCREILAAAKQFNCLDRLIGMTETSGLSAFEIACREGAAEIVLELMTVENFHLKINLINFLDRARRGYWRFPEKAKLFDDICLAIRKLIPDRRPVVDLTTVIFKPLDSYFVLFGMQPPTDPFPGKWPAIRKAIAEYYDLLINPMLCLPYLQFLNQELRRYYQSKYHREFPVLPTNAYTFKVVDGKRYSFPRHPYVGIKKHSVLQKCLVAIFRKHGLAQQTCKWLGYIPEKKAGEMFAKGDFCVENRYSQMLFHNKLSHMLQLLILLYAYESGALPLDYLTKGQNKRLAPLDILWGLSFFITPVEERRKTVTTFIRTNDSTIFSHVSFGDPHRLGSIIMFNGQQAGFKTLSDAMIDSFCKGAIRLTSALNAHLAPHDTIDTDKLAEQTNDTRTEAISVPSFLFKFCIHREIQKGRGAKTREVFEEGDASQHYAIIHKDYTPSRSFVPNAFIKP